MRTETIQLRYAGFEQAGSKRLFQFDCQITGRPTIRLAMSAEIGLFPAHRVSIQEGPTICARKLAGDQEARELTDMDLRSYAAEQALAADRTARAHSRPHNRLPQRRARSLHSGHWG